MDQRRYTVDWSLMVVCLGLGDLHLKIIGLADAR